jgi:2-methylaconitate cis-trans-isomerase PrpF
VWAGFGIVTLLLFIAAAILGLLGKKESAKIKGPDRTIAQIEQTRATLQSAVEQGTDLPTAESRALPER